MSFKRLIRFRTTSGSIEQGDAIYENGTISHARLIEGNVFGKYVVTERILEVLELLSPLSLEQISSVRCIGLNYQKHIIESNAATPTYPTLFYKPKGCITGPYSPIYVPKVAQLKDAEVDWEVELVVIIGKECKNVIQQRSLDYVLGFTIGNDVSQRTWQNRSSQFSVGKMFDSFAPLGPCIVNKNLIKIGEAGDINLSLQTLVNSEIRQSSNSGDMLFNVASLVSFTSQGTTLYPGDIIFTGTPEGTGMGMKPHRWLQNNDIVKCVIEDLGYIENKIIFE